MIKIISEKLFHFRWISFDKFNWFRLVVHEIQVDIIYKECMLNSCQNGQENVEEPYIAYTSKLRIGVGLDSTNPLLYRLDIK